MSEPEWQKSSFSAGGAENCMEFAAHTHTGTVHLRESDDPTIVLTTTPQRLSSLLNAIHNGALITTPELRGKQCGSP
jgi:hypothetical protein